MHETLEQDRIYVTVDMLILTVRDGKLNLLLSRRMNPPYAGRWALPGRFIGTEESAETAVRRLLEEMLPVEGAYLEQLYTFTDVNRDPRGRVISTAYLVILSQRRLEALLRERETSFLRFDIAEQDGLLLKGKDGTNLVGGDLAFDHSRIIETGIRRLRGKIDYTDVGFRFLNDPSAFSPGEQQTVFEAVLGKELDASNFRRFIRNRYEETGKISAINREEKAGRGRPAALYQMKTEGGREP